MQTENNARVGGGTNTFNTEEDFLIFLMEDEEEATSMWMTHVCLQAVSTMLNIEINILSTGVTPETSNRCVRCQPAKVFKNINDLILHKENVHDMKETQDDNEERIQRARWTELRPDMRIRAMPSEDKAAKLILLHDDDVHYIISFLTMEY